MPTIEEYYAKLKGPQIEAAKEARADESSACPLCKQAMEPTLLLSDRHALYCVACRVALPTPVL